MSQNITIFGSWADDFDALVAHDEKILDDYVEGQGYAVGTMVVASGLSAVMNFSKTFVDVGRLGNGVFVERNWQGLLADGLRALNLAGGVAAAVLRFPKLLRVAQQGNTCVATAQSNAIKLAGQKWLIGAEELAAKGGVTAAEWKQIVETGTNTVAPLQQAMSKMGILHHQLTEFKTLGELLAGVKSAQGGVITFAIEGIKNATMGHRLYAAWDKTAGLVIRDPNSIRTVYHTLADLQKAFGQSVRLASLPPLLLPRSVLLQRADVVETVAGRLVALLPWAVQYVPALQGLGASAETAAQGIDIRDRTEDGKAGAAKGEHVVKAGDTLGGIAKTHLGKAEKWPAVYSRNRKVIGKDPNRLKVGQKLVIPHLPTLKTAPKPAQPAKGSVPVS